MSWAKFSSGSSKKNVSPSRSSSAISPNPHNGNATAANTSKRRFQWMRRKAAPKRASSRTLRAASAGVVGRCGGAEPSFDIGVDDRQEFRGDAIAEQGDGLYNIHEQIGRATV